jgi:hypothetical protein
LNGLVITTCPLPNEMQADIRGAETEKENGMRNHQFKFAPVHWL